MSNLALQHCFWVALRLHQERQRLNAYPLITDLPDDDETTADELLDAIERGDFDK